VISFLIVHQGAIGDFILSLPAIEAIHSRYPEARFSFFGRPATLEIIFSRSYFAEIIDNAESRWASLYHSNPRIQPAAFGSLPQVDRVFAFGSVSSRLLVDNLASLLGTSSHRIDPFPDPSLGFSVSDYQCRQLLELGIPAVPVPPAIIAPCKQDTLEIRRFVREQVKTGKRLVIVHPGSGGKKKIWSPAGWLDIIERLSCYHNSQVVLLQGPADTDIIGKLRARMEKAPFIVLKNWNLGKLAALMRHAALYLGNDSGITHLAAACDTPTIALYGPTDPHIWGPRGSQVKIVQWQPQISSGDSDARLKDDWDSPPETDLVWEQAKKWLIV
jgi:ADP-heptose:LPS heptosyltransferase